MDRKLGKVYHKSKATFTAINVGRNRNNPAFKYPLRTNAVENQKIWNFSNPKPVAFVSLPVAYVFEPAWNKDMMSEEAKLELGFL